MSLKKYLFATLLLVVSTACNNLSVFVPPPRTSSLAGSPNVSVTDDGKLALDWEIRSKAAGSYEAYIIELDENDPSYQFQEGYIINPPLKIQAFTVPLEKSPAKIGTLVGSAEGLNMILGNQLRNDKKYLLQFVEKKLAASKKDPTAILVEVAFNTEVPATAAIVDDSIKITWSAVLGANRYLVYADKEMTVLIGESTINELVLPVAQGANLTEYFIHPMRGSLPAKETFSVKLNKSSAFVENVRSTTAAGLYTIGEELEFIVDFSKPVGVFGDAYLPLKIGPRVRKATYVSGQGTPNLTYRYTIQEGDNTEHLESDLVLGGEYADVNALSVSGALPSSEKSNSLKANNQIAIDTTKPSDPRSVGFSSSVSSDGNTTLSWNASTDLHFDTHLVKLCEDASCSTNCSAETSSIAPLINLAGLTQNIYYGCVQARDLVGLKSNWIASLLPHTVDSSGPTVVKISSTMADGIYKENQIIPITVEFSEPVFALGTSDIKLRLDTGSIDRDAVYSSGSGTKILSFDYTVQSGDVSADLNYDDPTSLTIGAVGSLKDAVGNAAILTLPAISSGNSLAQQKSLIIDTTSPTLPAAVSFAGTASLTNSLPITWNNSTDANFKTHNVKICTSNTCASGCLTPMTANSSPVTATGVDGATYYACVQGEDLVGHRTTWVVSAASIQIDSTAPTVLSVNSLSSNGVYKTGDTIDITVQFSESVLAANTGDIKLHLETGTNDQDADYVSGSGTDVLLFRYTVQSGDESADLDYLSTTALDLGASGTITDAATHPAILTLPALGSTHSLAGTKAISIDTQAPTDPSNIAFAAALTNNTALSVSWTASADPHFDHYNLKLCSDTACSVSCISSTTSGISPTTLNGVDGGIYHACVQGEDTLGYQSAWVASAGTATIDANVPTITDVTATNNDGYLTTAADVNIEVKFSKGVIVTSGSDLALALAMSPTVRNASYVGGSGTDTLTFRYTIAAGDTAEDLDYTSTTALSLGSNGAIRDAAGNAADLTLPAPGAAHSIGAQKALIVDTTKPTNPSAIGFTSALSSTTAIDVSWSESTDTHFATHNLKLCTASNCSTGCISDQTSLHSPATLTGVNGGTYYACVQGQDAQGLTSSWRSSISTVTIDSVAATITDVTSTANDGAYKAGAVIPITVTFSKNVYVTSTSDIKLQLETGSTDQLADYVSGHGTTTLLFQYTVQSGDTSADLNYVDTTSLQLNGTATIKDLAGANAVLTLPALTDSNHIAGHKAIVIDTTAPAAPLIQTPADSAYLPSNVTVVSGTSEANASIELKNGATVIGTANADASGNWSITLGSPLSDGTYSLTATAKDAAQNIGPASGATSFTVDTSDPQVPSIDVLDPVVYSTVPTITGTSEAGVTISLYANGSPIGTTTANGSGVWSITPSQPADNDYVLTATATDSATRVSAASTGVNLGIDTAAPSAPANITFNTPLSLSTSVPVNFDVSSDPHFKQHNLKFCEAAGCATCTTETTAADSPATLLGLNNKDYYACVQGEDVLGQKSAWVSSASLVQINSNETNIVSVSSTDSNGVYKEGQSLSISVEFSRVVTASTPSSLRLLLETGTTDREATYVSGSGSTTLVFTYVIQSGDASQDLNYQNTNALTLNGSDLLDPSLANANLTLPPLASASSLKGMKNLKVDTTAPTDVPSVGFAGTYSNSTSFPLTWTASTDLNLDGYNVKLCEASDCTTTCGSTSSTTALTLSMTGVNGSSYYGCVQAKDTALHTSTWVSTLNPIAVDTTVPTVTDIDSSLASGSYTVGQVVPILVTFSENVFVVPGSGITLKLETGTPDRSAVYASGSGGSVLTFHYTVQSGDTSPHLNVWDTSSLSLASGASIKDVAGSNATLTLPNLTGADSLYTHKTIVIDTTAPAAPILTNPTLTAYSTTTVNSISGTSETDALISVYNGSTVLGTTTATGTNWTLNLGSALSDGVYSIKATAKDAAGNISVDSAVHTLTVDTSPPDAPVVSSLTSPTTDNTPTISGTSEPFMEITVYASGVAKGTTQASSLGNWTLDTSTLADGDYTITAKATDPGSRTSAASNSVALSVDTAAPSDPSAITFTNAYNPTTSVDFSWTASTDPHLSGYTYKLCTAVDCATGCTAEATTSGLTATVTGVNGTTYYACVQAQDTLDQKTSFIASAGTSKVDTSAPTISSVSSGLVNGYYKTGQVVDIWVNFNESVVVTNQAQLGLTLETGTTDRVATYMTTSGNTLVFRYIVQAGDTSADLDYVSTSALSLGSGGTIKDLAGNAAILTLPNPGDTNSLGAAKAIVIDTTAPTLPGSVAFPNSITNSPSNTLSWTASTDANLLRYNTQLCTNAACSTGCIDATNTTSLSASKTGTSGNTYYGCVQAEDRAGQTSAWAASGSLQIDTTAPTIVSVTSPKDNGSYGAGTTIPITIEFSKTVIVTSGSAIGITLETGTTDQRVIYSSGSNSTILTFNYVVQAGDTSSDLGYENTGSLTLGAGTIKDSAGNNASLTLPAQPGAGSLKTNKDIVIDTSNPLAPVITSPAVAYVMSTVTTVTGTSEPNALITLKNNGVDIGSATANSSGNWTVTPSTALSDGNYSLTAIATDAANNASPTSATKTFEVDTSAPTAPVITAHPFPTNDTTPTVSGTSEPNMTIKLYVAGTTEVGSTTADGSGNWSIDSSTRSPGTYSWTAKAFDVGGRSSAASSAVSGTIDTTAPSVSSVTASNTDGYRKLGQSVSVQVVFTESVAITGNPTLTLETGTTDAVVSYYSGSGTNTLVFRYTVASGENSPDLDYVSTSALVGTIKDLAGNAANLTLPAPGAANSLGANKNFIVDGIVPTILSVTSSLANGAYGATNVIPVSVTFSEAVTLASGTPSVALNTTPAQTANYTGGSGTLVYNFSYTVATGDVSADLNYAALDSLVTHSTIRDAAGNDADLTLPALASSNSLGGSKNIEIAGNSPAIALNATPATQNAYVGTAISPVNVNLTTGGDTTAAPDSRAVSYVCKFDRTANSAMDSGGTDCSTLVGASFNASTGVLSWTPNAADASSWNSQNIFEFQVTGTSTANRSGNVLFAINVLRPFTSTFGFDTGTEADYNLGSGVTMANGKISLDPLDQDDAGTDSSWSATTTDGAWYRPALGMTKLALVGGKDGTTLNLAGTGARTTEWVPSGSNVVLNVPFEQSGNDITVPSSNAATSSTAQKRIQSRSFYFNGSTYVTTAVPTTGNLTVNIWFQTTQTWNTDCTNWMKGPGIYTGDVSGNVKDWGIHMCDGYIMAGTGFPSNTEPVLKSSVRFNDGNWHMATFTRGTGGTLKLYVDGQLHDSGSGVTGNLTAPTEITVGHVRSGAGVGFVGYLDELTVWNTILSEESIQVVYRTQASKNSGVFISRVMDAGITSAPWTGLKWTSTLPFNKELPDAGTSETTADYPNIIPDLMNGIRGLWHLNETSSGTAPSGNDFADSSGQGNHGVAVGSPIYGQGGRLYNAPLLDGSLINLGSAPNLNFGNGSFTVSAWFRATATGSNRIFTNGMNGAVRGMMLQLNQGKMRFGICNDTGTASTCSMIQTTALYNDNAWHHVVGILNRGANKMSIWMDGRLAQTTQDTTYTCGTNPGGTTLDVSGCTYNASTKDYAAIGGRYTGSSMTERLGGYIDEVAAWNRNLSSEETLQLYRRGANRVWFQVRSCAISDCSDGTWQGVAGGSASYISELQNTVDGSKNSNTLTTSPVISFANYPNLTVANARYFQYKMIMESDDSNALCNYGSAENCSPEITSVTALPNHYPTSNFRWFEYKNVAANFYSLGSFGITYGPAGCSNGAKLVANTSFSSWKYYNGTSWAAGNSTSDKASTLTQINNGAASFGSSIGRSTLYIGGFLTSDGTSPCEIDTITINGNSAFN